MDVVDRNGQRVVGQKISLTSNQQKGSLVLPGNIRPGLYTVAIYPDWMADMSPSLFLTTSLYVAGDADKQELAVPVFAEGGTLVEGLAGTIVFYAPDAVENAQIVNAGEQVMASGLPNTAGFGGNNIHTDCGRTLQVKNNIAR